MRKSWGSDLAAQSSDAKQILIRQWLFLAFFGALLLALVATSSLSKVSTSKELARQIHLAQKPISITLQGAVKRPGVYLVQPGSTLQDLLKEVELSENADRRKAPLKKVFLVSQTLTIAEKKR